MFNINSKLRFFRNLYVNCLIYLWATATFPTRPRPTTEPINRPGNGNTRPLDPIRLPGEQRPGFRPFESTTRGRK